MHLRSLAAVRSGPRPKRRFTSIYRAGCANPRIRSLAQSHNPPPPSSEAAPVVLPRSMSARELLDYLAGRAARLERHTDPEVRALARLILKRGPGR